MTRSSERLICLLISLGINDLVLSSVLIPDKNFRSGCLQSLLLNRIAICTFSPFLFALLIDLKCFLKIWNKCFCEEVAWMSAKELRW